MKYLIILFPFSCLASISEADARAKHHVYIACIKVCTAKACLKQCNRQYNVKRSILPENSKKAG